MKAPKRSRDYSSFNRLVNFLALHKICVAGDGVAFDAHLTRLLQAHNKPDFCSYPQPLSHIEQKRIDRGTDQAHRQTDAVVFPQIFAMLGDLAQKVDKETFVDSLYIGGDPRMMPPTESQPQISTTDPTVRDAFARYGFASVDNTFSPALLRELSHVLRHGPYKPRHHPGIGHESQVIFNPGLVCVFNLLSSPSIRCHIEDLTGVVRGSLGHYNGRVYRMTAQEGQGGWHNDADPADRRVIGCVLSLHTTVPRGGDLVFRRGRNHRPLGRLSCGVIGRLNLFRIEQAIEHRVEPVEGNAPRLVCAGWYIERV